VSRNLKYGVILISQWGRRNQDRDNRNSDHQFDQGKSLMSGKAMMRVADSHVWLSSKFALFAGLFTLGYSTFLFARGGDDSNL